MASTTFTTVALDTSTWPAFAALVEANGGIFGGCWCVAFHPKEPGERSPEINRERKLRRVQDETAMRPW